jgi:hypothetical protein
MHDTSRRWPTATARTALAARFDLSYSVDMQDWEWEVADAQRFEEFLDAYRSANLSDDERFSLMEILVQCVEDLALQSTYAAGWSAIEPLLLSNARLHRTTIAYWACLGRSEPEARFQVSASMRHVWGVISS